jgi:AcrR family transcriptional regulator
MPKVVPEYKDEARRKIIEAAIAEADEKGFSDLKMDDIAARLGISRATLYLYFKSKEDLVFASHSVIRSRLSELMQDAFCRESLDDAFDAIFDEFIYPEDGKGLNLILEIFAGAVRDDRLHAAIRNNYLTIRDTVVEVLEEQKAAGRLPDDLDALLAAELIQSVILGIKMGAAVGLGRDEARRIWNAALRRILA